MGHSRSWSWLLLIACSAGLAGLAVRQMMTDASPPAPAFCLDAAEKALEPCQAGRKYEVVFTITNHGDSPFAILGADNHCGPTCCLMIEREWPVTIPPGSRLELPVKCMPNGAGHFEETLALYTSAPGQAEIILTVRGETAE